MTKVVWRDWYSPAAVKELIEFGTLPREVAEVELGPNEDGVDVARAIVELINADDTEAFRDGGRIVIVEPPELAGTYRVDVDYVPTFSAYREDDDVS